MKTKHFNFYLGILAILASVFLLGTETLAAIRTVGSGGAAPNYTTIASAMAAASSGDTIQVLPGTYYEDVVLTPQVLLFGSGPEQTTIHGTYSGTGSGSPAVLMAEGSMISGFRVTGGFVGISSWDCTSIIANNVVTANYHMGVSLIADADYSVVNSLVINNTIADNIPASGSEFCAGIYTEPQGAYTEASPIIMNNVITGHKFGISPYLATPKLSYNNIWDNWENYGYSSVPGPGDISENPQYTDSNYHLALTSPCIDAGNPGPQYIDQDGTVNDIGAYGGVAGPGYGDGFHTGSGFIFTSVGKIPTSEITQDDGDPSFGLANVSDKAAAIFRIPKYKDSPFGGNLWLHGLFGQSDNVAYYQILVGEWVGRNKPTTYVPLNDPLGKVRYTINPDGTVSHQYVNLGPKEISGIPSLYQLTTSGFWSHIDLRMIWNTRLWPNGKYTLVYRAYNGYLNRLRLPANDLDHLTIIVDNSPVDAQIHHVKYDPSSPFYDPGSDGEIPECGMIYLTHDQENLRFTITARHPNGYLKNYVLDALYGKNKYAGVIKSAAYPPAFYKPPFWYGIQEAQYNSADATSLDPWRRCAYQFRLRVYSRTTDGYHYIISKEFNDHYFLELKQCLADLDNDGDVDGDDLNRMADEFGSAACMP